MYACAYVYWLTNVHKHTHTHTHNNTHLRTYVYTPLQINRLNTTVVAPLPTQSYRHSHNPIYPYTHPTEDC